MARTHARILTSIWADDDFTHRTPDEQWLFFALLSQRDLTTCGVLNHNSRRLARLAPGMTAKRIDKALGGLEAARFIVVDHDTGEIIFRTFLRHDGVLLSPNILKGAARAYDRIHSPTIRQVVTAQLPKDIRALWPQTLLTTDPKTLGEILRRNPSHEGSGDFPDPGSLIPDPGSPLPPTSSNGATPTRPKPAAAAATPGTAHAEHQPAPPPPELLARFRRPQPPDPHPEDQGFGHPEATGPDESPDDSNRRRALALRWQDVLHERGTKADLAACNRAVAEALHHADARIVDEQIGWQLTATTPPRTPHALVTAVHRITR